MSTSISPTPTLLISHLPAKTLLGIDLLSFASTPSFHGIKDLPSGAHFLYTGTTASFSLRSGEWFFISQNNNGGGAQDVRLRKWDAGVEGLVPIDERGEEGRKEAMALRANLGRVWRGGGLLAYRLRAPQGNQNDDDEIEGAEQEQGHERSTHPRSEWNRLSEYISPAVLSRILGRADLESDDDQGSSSRGRWTVSSGSSASQDVDHIPGLTPTEAERAGAGTGSVASEQEKELHFLPIDLKRTWRMGAVGRERTEAAQDKSWALGDLIGKFSEDGTVVPDRPTTTAGERQILGEMQFTFLMVLTLMNFSCLEQWKRLLGLILTCRAAISAREMFFVEILQLLRLQLKHCDDVEGGLFEMDGDDGASLLKKLLTGFRTIVDEFGTDAVLAVKAELENLENWVKEEYGWELRRGAIVRRGMVELEDGERVELEISGTEEDDETGEYAPVIVEMPEEGDGYGAGADFDMVDTEIR